MVPNGSKMLHVLTRLFREVADEANENNGHMASAQHHTHAQGSRVYYC